jgi:hypothetical protein
MRRNVSYRTGGGPAALPLPGDPGNALKAGFAGLLPGGMTLDAEPGTARLLHDISPEPVHGHGDRKRARCWRAVVPGFWTIAG